jgi:endogenous inhibitor of DNA gyrase (YacG/DUF329 family)
MAARTRHVCPICGKESHPRHARAATEGPDAGAVPDNPSFPFCSPPCKLVDLGSWLDGAYRIPGPPVAIDVGTEQGDGEPHREEDA